MKGGSEPNSELLRGKGQGLTHDLLEVVADNANLEEASREGQRTTPTITQQQAKRAPAWTGSPTSFSRTRRGSRTWYAHQTGNDSLRELREARTEEGSTNQDDAMLERSPDVAHLRVVDPVAVLLVQRACTHEDGN
jgi:hypothetical protein